MANRLYDRLDKIKREKREIRMSELEAICTDNDIINDALDIAKHESGIYLPGVALIMAVAALILSFYNNSLILSLFPSSPEPIQLWDKIIKALPVLFVFILALIFVLDIFKRYFLSWMEIYYDLIELRMMRREEKRPTILSKLDEIIDKVDKINPKIEVLEKNLIYKMEFLEKDVLSIKKK